MSFSSLSSSVNLPIQKSSVEGDERDYRVVKRLAFSIHWLGRKISTYSCFEFSAEQFVKIFVRAIRPGKQDQCNRYSAELAVRITFAIPVIALTLATIAFGILGFGLQGIGNKILIKYGHNFSFEKPDQSKIVTPTNVETLKICTFNAAQMPDFMVAVNNVRPSTERIHQLAEQILEKDDDVICLQEMFSHEGNQNLVEMIKHKYPYIVYNVAPNPTGLNSGLVIISKYPLKNPQFWKHEELGGACKYANKGVLGVIIELGKDSEGNNKEAFVFTTHLNAEASENGKNDGHFRHKQLERMECEIVPEYISKHESLAKCVGIFRCGDYNVGPRKKAATLIHNSEWRRASPILERLKQKNAEAQIRENIDGGLSVGTTFDVDSNLETVVRPDLPGQPVKDVRHVNTGWDLDNVQDWAIFPEHLDHILTEQPEMVIETHVDPMNGASDHLAVRACLGVQSKVSIDEYCRQTRDLYSASLFDSLFNLETRTERRGSVADLWDSFFGKITLPIA